jgi:hypothetical protein
MRNRRARPMRHHQIDRAQLGQVVGPRRPLRVEVTVAAPYEIAHVRQFERVAVQGAGNLSTDFRRPIGVNGFDRAPPNRHTCQRCGEEGEDAPSRAPELREDRCETEQAKQDGGEEADRILSGKAVPQGERRPSRRQEHEQGQEEIDEYSRPSPQRPSSIGQVGLCRRQATDCLIVWQVKRNSASTAIELAEMSQRETGDLSRGPSALHRA